MELHSGWKSDVGVAIPAALDAGEIRCQSFCLTAGLFPLSLCLSLMCEWLFKAGQVYLHSLPPSRLVWGYSFSRGEVDIYDLEVPVTDVFVSLYYEKITNNSFRWSPGDCSLSFLLSFTAIVKWWCCVSFFKLSYIGFPIVQFQKISILSPTEIPRGRGFWKPQEKYEAKLEFPGKVGIRLNNKCLVVGEWCVSFLLV